MSLLIVRQQILSSIQVLNCKNCNQCLNCHKSAWLLQKAILQTCYNWDTDYIFRKFVQNTQVWTLFTLNTYFERAMCISNINMMQKLVQWSSAACQHQSVSKTTAAWHCRATSCRGTRTSCRGTRHSLTYCLSQFSLARHMPCTHTNTYDHTLALASLMDVAAALRRKRTRNLRRESLRRKRIQEEAN